MAERSLRYSSLQAMPPALRKRVERQQAGAPTVPAMPKVRAPRKDIEHEQQVIFFNRIRTMALNDARYRTASKRTYAIPNGGGRSRREAGRLKAEGVTPGVSDIFCSIARGGWHGLYIEMKSPTGPVSKEQREWIADSVASGYWATVCRSADEAMDVWRSYVDGLLPDPIFIKE